MLGIKASERGRLDRRQRPKAEASRAIWIGHQYCNNLAPKPVGKAGYCGGGLHVIWPWQDRSGRFSWLKASALTLVAFPGIRFVYQVAAGDYGILSMALGGMVYWSGVWATVILLMALAVTPALTILRWHALVDVRRMIGVTALVYTVAHIIIYFALRSWSFAAIANETVTRLTLVVATLSTIGLIALGATSLDAAIRRMGPRNWQRLHNMNYAISALAVLHVVLARGTYPEQYALAGVFVWLMAWRVLAHYGLGADAKALFLLAAASSLFTALLEAGMVWGRRGYELSWTLGNNFNLAMLDVGVPPAWQALTFGLLFMLAAAGRRAPRVWAAGLEARKSLAARKVR
jgi:methionine sulfoxide reductase heme-binding subunit